MFKEEDTRGYWLTVLHRLAHPVLENLVQGKLKERIPEMTPGERNYSPLEALGRLLVGIAPWLESGPTDGAEGKKRLDFCAKARLAIEAGTDPASPDFMNFSSGKQPLVDAALLAQAMLRAPRELWSKLETRVKENVVRALRSTRDKRPSFSNWLMFGAMIETALYRIGESWDPMRVDYALRQHEQWYLGDGAYGDGVHFHWDYYNSFIIHPMLVDVLHHIDPQQDWIELKPLVFKRAQRLAEVLERLISPEGTVPPLGRSLTYRFGIFHGLSQMALWHGLPAGLSAPQVRCGMTAVLRRMMEMPGTFDGEGWLRPGLCGFQAGLAESYISTGSLYFCAAGLLPLGLPPTDDFWQGAPRDWTAKSLWSGVDGKADHYLNE